jgi:predicted butyrate kinase (DUF1464 family)
MSAKRVRVAGTDPGTSSLDVLLLDDGRVTDQIRFLPDQLRADPSLPVRWLHERGPLDLVAGPSGYGLPLVRGADCTESQLALMSLVRPDERDRAGGVAGFSAVVRAFRDSGLPVVFLPGVIHLSTVPRQRKLNRIDLGTADKLCVAALALTLRSAAGGGDPGRYSACVVELGSAFTACVVLAGGRVVDGCGGTCGPAGWRSGGAWDGETAYLLSPLGKDDLFAGGAAFAPDAATGEALLRESLLRTVAGLLAVTPVQEIVLSGRLLQTHPELAGVSRGELARLAAVELLPSLPGAWVKQAAQGAALLADGLAGGASQTLVESLQLREAAGTVLDHLTHPRAQEVRRAFLG